MIDSSIVRVHQHGSCIGRDERHCTGRSRGGLTTKIHAVVDRRGLPLRVDLSAGQEHDSVKATTCSGISWEKERCSPTKHTTQTRSGRLPSPRADGPTSRPGATARTQSASAHTFTALAIRSSGFSTGSSNADRSPHATTSLPRTSSPSSNWLPCGVVTG
ncbi:hypothetical protein AJ87_35740 [Rhizobium yanglingense]|nr:hypothetical protein AJ87_35740 [Rhizobium yanglingense]